MAFTATIAALPGHAKTADAKGFLPPFIRGMGHLLYLLADTAATEPKLTIAEVEEELKDAEAHWTNFNGKDVLSTPARDQLGLLNTAITEALVEWEGWDAATRTRNMRDLVNRAVGFSVTLDRELLGLTDSDAGHNL